jgi:putative molybdopterin biosynthesis protein
VIVGALVDRGYSVRILAVGSLGGVAAANRGECDIAPVHLIDPATGQYNKHLVGPGLSLVRGWRRMQGILFRPGDERFEGRTVQEALKSVLADSSALMINRNAGAGTRVLTDKLLDGAQPAGYANQPKSHNAVAAAIAQGRADWGVAIEPVAKLYGLSFLPVSPEHYDFLVADNRRERMGVQAFLAALRDERVRTRVRALGMEPSTD